MGNTQRWILERGRISCQRHSYTCCSESEGVLAGFLRDSFWPQLKWGNREPGIIFQKEIACGKNKMFNIYTSVEMRYTCQVTNQSSHGELSFHHNPHLRLCWGLCLSTSRVIRRGGTRLKNAAHPTYCHCCELCAIKQNPGVLLEKLFQQKKHQIPTADRTHH